MTDAIGQVPELHVIVIPGTHAVKEQLGVIDDAQAASGDLQDILNLWQLSTAVDLSGMSSSFQCFQIPHSLDGI